MRALRANVLCAALLAPSIALATEPNDAADASDASSRESGEAATERPARRATAVDVDAAEEAEDATPPPPARRSRRSSGSGGSRGAPSLTSAADEGPNADTPARDTHASRGPSPSARDESLQLSIGVRTTFVRNAGYDVFSTNDALSQFSLGAIFPVLHRGRVALALGGVWDYGGSTASARGAEARLRMHRLSAPIEGRLFATDWLFGFARLAPGVAVQTVTVNDSSAPGRLLAERPLFVTDASVGVATVLSGRGPLRVGLSGDIGYALVPSMALRLRPDLADDDPRATGSVDLGSIATGGAFFRIAALASF
jgi:hypothetical protein